MLPKGQRRNLVPQIITQKDGTTKTIFHKKKMPNGSFKEIWNQWNMTPKPNSKRSKAKANSFSETVNP